MDGNKLPDPIIIFAILCLGTLLLSLLAGGLGWNAKHPGTGKVITAVNLLTTDGMRVVLGDAITTFGAFAPLGQVLIIMLGIGVAERSGWFETMLSHSMRSAPKMLVVPAIAFIGLFGNIAGDAAPSCYPHSRRSSSSSSAGTPSQASHSPTRPPWEVSQPT